MGGESIFKSLKSFLWKQVEEKVWKDGTFPSWITQRYEFLIELKTFFLFQRNDKLKGSDAKLNKLGLFTKWWLPRF